MYPTLEFDTTVELASEDLNDLPAEKDINEIINRGLFKAARDYINEVEFFGCTGIERSRVTFRDKRHLELNVRAIAVLPPKSYVREVSEIYTRDELMVEDVQAPISFFDALMRIFATAVMEVHPLILRVDVDGEPSKPVRAEFLEKLEQTDFRRVRQALVEHGAKNKPKLRTVSKSVRTKKNEAENVLQKLMQMPGLEEPKEILQQIIANAKVEQEQRKRGMEIMSRSWHMAFLGEPGTAKTTFAKGVASVLADSGIVSSRKFLTYSRADLVGRYIGESEEKTKEALERGRGGVIFIDEAYALVGEGNDYGRVVIDQLIAFMENHRNDTVFIFAGYPHKMEEFFDMNEGLRSRIMFHVPFKSYSDEEMWEILNLLAKEAKVVVKKNAKKRVLEYFSIMRNKPGFGNGRTARNYLEQSINHQRVRLYQGGALEKVTNEELITLEPQDFVLPIDEVTGVRSKIGFDTVA